MQKTVWKLELFFRKNDKTIKWILVLLFLGIIAGSAMILYIDSQETARMTAYFKTFLVNNHLKEYGTKYLFLHSFLIYGFFFFMIWLFGFFKQGRPLILFLVFLKGLIMGFTTSFFIKAWMIKGFLFTLLVFLPQNLVILPILVYISTSSFFQSSTNKNTFGRKYNKNLSWSYALLFLFSIMILGIYSFSEAFFMPKLLNLLQGLLS